MRRRPSRRRRRVPAAIALLGLLGCGGSSQTGPDGSAGGPCDPAAQTGCAGGQKCALVCTGATLAFACVVAAGTADVGQACSTDDDCRAGGFCAATPAVPTPTCVQFCAVTSDCLSGTCQSRPATVGACRQPLNVSICE